MGRPILPAAGLPAVSLAYPIGCVNPPQLQIRDTSYAPRFELQPGFDSRVVCVGQKTAPHTVHLCQVCTSFPFE